MNKFLLVLVVILSLIFNAIHCHKNLHDKFHILDKLMDTPKELFKAYYSLFEKHTEYEINGQEGVRKYKIFHDNLARIAKMNEEAGKEIYGITKFTDWTHAERQAILMTPEQVMKQLGKEHILRDMPSIPSFTGITINPSDFRSQLNEARDQKNCGSCWSFAAMGAVEGNYNLQFGELKQLSEQYLLDCDDLDNGCNGGWPSNTFKWLKSNGVRNLSERPYLEKKAICNSSEKLKFAENIVEGQIGCEDPYCTVDHWLKLLASGPIIVAMDASSVGINDYRPKDGQEYPFVPNMCSKINHAVVAVGVKMLDNKPHLLIRNSWGSDWGIKGYFWVPADKHCFILDYAWLPQVHRPTEFKEPNCLDIYTDCAAGTEKQEGCGGVSDAEATFGGPIKGFEMPVGTECEYWNFYTEKNCKGTRSFRYESSKCFADGYSWLPSEYKSFTQGCDSPDVGCLYLYTSGCLGGDKIKICENIADIESSGLNVIAVSSIYINEQLAEFPGTVDSMILFADKNFSGKAYAVGRGKLMDINDNQDLLIAMGSAKSLALVLKK
jgi:hypothetical protein